MTELRRSSPTYRTAFFKAFLAFVLLITATISHPQLAHATGAWDVVPDGDSGCHLSDAITANNNGGSAYGSCPAGDGTIQMAAGTYTLTANLPVIDHALTINGSGVGSTIIDGQDQYYVFYDDGPYLNGVSNLTIKNAGTGAGTSFAIASDGSTDIDNVVVYQSTGGGILASESGATITNTAVVNDSSNHAALDIPAFSGTYNITNVTLYGNYIGVYVPAYGGTVNITNATIASNSGGSGINFIDESGDPTVNLENSILDNTVNCSGSAIDGQGNNIVSDNSCGLIGTSEHVNTDPELGALTTSDGTEVLPITYTSPAYAAATTGAPPTDQRGVSRPQCGVADIGAYEQTTCAPSGGGSGSGSTSSSPSKTVSKGSSGTANAGGANAAATTSSKTDAPISTPDMPVTTKGSAPHTHPMIPASNSSSHWSIWVGIIVVLLALVGCGWFLAKKNPKKFTKFLRRFHHSR